MANSPPSSLPATFEVYTFQKRPVFRPVSGECQKCECRANEERLEGGEGVCVCVCGHKWLPRHGIHLAFGGWSRCVCVCVRVCVRMGVCWLSLFECPNTLTLEGVAAPLPDLVHTRKHTHTHTLVIFVALPGLLAHMNIWMYARFSIALRSNTRSISQA